MLSLLEIALSCKKTSAGHLKCKEHMTQPIAVENIWLSCYYQLMNFFDKDGTETLNVITEKKKNAETEYEIP